VIFLAPVQIPKYTKEPFGFFFQMVSFLIFALLYDFVGTRICKYTNTNETHYASFFGGLQGSRSTSRATMTRNIKKQQPTKTTPAQQRRKRRGGATGGIAGEVRYAMTF
jgi:hypothetical protein